MGRGRRDDDDHVDRGVMDRLERIGHGALRTPELPAPLRGGLVRVGHHDDVRVRDRRDVAQVGPAHPSGTQHGDADVVGIAQREAAHARVTCGQGRSGLARASARDRHLAAFGAVGLQSMSHA